MGKLIFDKDNLRFSSKQFSIWHYLWLVTKYVLVSFLMAALCYSVLAIFFDTPAVEKVKNENERMSKELKSAQKRIVIIERSISSLIERDKGIYSQIFGSEPPVAFRAGGSDEMISVDDFLNMSEKSIVKETNRRMKDISPLADSIRGMVNAMMASALSDSLSQSGSYPCIFPFRTMTVEQAGASVGKKINPFYKSFRDHNGIDLMAQTGTEVLSTADGVVMSVNSFMMNSDGKRVVDGSGNNIVISHRDGYETVYSHLQNIYVRTGQHVKVGDLIGTVGMTGTSFAPHLHYEVHKNGVPVEPVHYFCASMSPSEYAEMLFIVRNTGQSMD